MENQPISFTPYIGVDENVYSQVGLMKQQQYDQNVQKIQGYIDNISGIEAARDVDKQYIKSKVDGVISQLNSIPGADWSTKQVLNQAGTLASTLGRDVNIRAAQLSAFKIKQLQASQKELKSKNPERYTPQAEYWDNQEVQKYLASTELGTSYSGPTEATPYANYHENLDKMLKELSPEIQYKLDNSGNFQYYVDKNSTVSPAKIQQAVNTFFSSRPEYKTSLQMDALYSFKDYTPADMSQSIEGLVSKMEGEYDKTINSLKEINETYNKQIKNDPNNYELITKLKKDIADNEAIAKNYESAKATNIKALRDPKNLNSIKYELFKDNVVANSVITYQKDIHEFVKNEDLIRKEDKYLEYIKAGLDPASGMPLTVDSPLYAAYTRARKSSKKDGTGGAGTGDVDFSETPITIAQPDKSYNTSYNESQIQQLEGSAQAINSKLRSLYPNYSNAEFDNYKIEQERKIENGEKADPNYLDYKKRMQPINVELGALKKLKSDAAQTALDEFPLSNIGKIVIDGVSLQNQNGTNVKKIEIDPEKHGAFLTKAKRIENEINNAAAKQFNEYISKNVKSEIMSPTAQMYNTARAEVLSKYTNDQDFQILRELVNKDKLKNITQPLDNVLKQRIKREDQILEEKGKEFSPKLYTFEAKKEDLDSWRRTIHESHLATKEEDVDISKIEPIGVWKQTDGTTNVRYQIGKETYDAQIPVDKEVLPNQDPYAWLYRVVESTGSTAKEGPGVLTSDDGKIRYYIAKNVWGGGYDAYILEGNNPIKIIPKANPNDVNSTTLVFRTPGEIYAGMNKMSSTLNPVTQKQFSRDEANYYLTHDSDEFLQYMNKKLNR